MPPTMEQAYAAVSCGSLSRRSFFNTLGSPCGLQLWKRPQCWEVPRKGSSQWEGAYAQSMYCMPSQRYATGLQAGCMVTVLAPVVEAARLPCVCPLTLGYGLPPCNCHNTTIHNYNLLRKRTRGSCASSRARSCILKAPGRRSCPGMRSMSSRCDMSLICGSSPATSFTFLSCTICLATSSRFVCRRKSQPSAMRSAGKSRWRVQSATIESLAVVHCLLGHLQQAYLQVLLSGLILL